MSSRYTFFFDNLHHMTLKYFAGASSFKFTDDGTEIKQKYLQSPEAFTTPLDIEQYQYLSVLGNLVCLTRNKYTGPLQYALQALWTRFPLCLTNCRSSAYHHY